MYVDSAGRELIADDDPIWFWVSADITIKEVGEGFVVEECKEIDCYHPEADQIRHYALRGSTGWKNMH